MSPMGWLHTGFALAALILGSAVVLGHKGGRLHRTLGHLYFGSMLVTNITAFSLYRLTGSFTPFHVAAVMSLATLTVGMSTVILRRPRRNWLEIHAYTVNGSYIGVVAAFFAEIFTRMAGEQMWLVAGVTSAVVIGVGMALMFARTPISLGKAPPHRNRI